MKRGKEQDRLPIRHGFEGSTKKDPLDSITLLSAAISILRKYRTCSNPIPNIEHEKLFEKKLKLAIAGKFPNNATANQARRMFKSGDYHIWRIDTVTEEKIKCQKVSDILMKQGSLKYEWKKKEKSKENN